MKKYVLIIMTTLLLSGCAAGLFLAGAGAGGAIVADNRDIPTMRDDHIIAHKIGLRIDNKTEFKGSRVIASSYNRVVLLAGQVKSPDLKTRAEQITKNVDGVKRVYNEITVAKPITLKEQSKEAWITTQVKSKMLAENGLKTSHIKVITENGTVYLMGIADRSDINLAVDVARRVDGVKRVVKLFEYS